MSTVAKLLARLELDTTGFQSGLNSIPGMLNSVGGSMTQIGGTITRGITLPLIAAGAAVVALGGHALKTGADFEKAMSGVGAIVGATESEIKQLSDTAIKLGMDPNLIVSASQAAGVMEELAKNGLTAQEIMGGAAEGAIALANATGTDFATAAQIASTAMALFNIEAADMATVVDQVTAVANMSRFTAEDFASAVGMGGAAAKSAGVDFKEFTAVIASLADYTTSGSDAGTSFKTFLTRLVPITDKATEAMMELGMITEDGANRFFDAEGNMRSMAEVAGILQETLSGLSEEQRISALHTIFGTDASRAAIGLMETGQQGFEDLMATMAKTDAAKNAETRMNNLAGAVEILGGIFETFQIKFTQAIGPGVRAMVEGFSNFLSKNSVQIENLFVMLAGVFDGFGTGFTEWLNANGPRMIEFFGNVIKALPSVIEKIGSVAAAMAPVIEKVFNAIMSMKPETIANIMMVVGALALLGPILSAVGPILSTVSGLLNFGGGGGATGGGGILGTIMGLIGFLTKLIPIAAFVVTILNAFGVSTGAVGAAILALNAGLFAIIWPLLLIIATVALVVYAFATDFMGISTTVMQLGFIIKFYFEQAANWMITNIKKGGDFIVTKFQQIMTTAFQLKAIFDVVMKGISNAIQKVINKVIELAKKLLSLVLPKDLKPGSPTPFEIGLLGIANAMDRINQTGLAGLSSPKIPGMSPTASSALMRSESTGGSSSQKTINVNITNPKKETSEESVRKTMNKLSYLRVLE